MNTVKEHKYNLMQKKSLIRQLLYMITLFMSSVMVVLAVVFIRFFFYYRSAVMSYAEIFLNTYAQNSENELKQFENAIRVFLSESDMQDAIKVLCNSEDDVLEGRRAAIKVGTRIADFNSRFNYLKGIVFFDTDGVYRAAMGSNLPNRKKLDELCALYSDKENPYNFIIHESLDNTLLFVCNVVKISPTGYETLSLAMVVVNTEELFGVFQEGEIFSGQFAIRGDRTQGVISSKSMDPELLKALPMNQESGGQIFSYDRQNYYVISSNDQNNIFSYQLVIPMKEIDGENIRFLMWTVLCILFIFALTGVLVWFCVRNIVIPVKRVKKDIAVVESGEFNVSSEESFEKDSENEIDLLHMNLCRSIRRLQMNIQEKQEFLNLLQEERFKQLYLQMNPHFLYNTLDIIYWDAMAEGCENTAEMINCMGRMFRYATDIKQDIVTVAEEIRLLEAYSTIMHMRYENRLEIRMQIAEQFLSVRIPKFSIQPILENAVGIMMKTGAEHSLIIVAARCAEEKIVSDMLEIYVLDEGAGISEEMMEAIRSGSVKSMGTGIALYSIHQRLQHMFGSDCGIFSARINGMSAVGFRIRMNSEQSTVYEETRKNE